MVDGPRPGAESSRRPDVLQQELVSVEVAALKLVPGAAENTPSYERDLHVVGGAVGDLQYKGVRYNFVVSEGKLIWRQQEHSMNMHFVSWGFEPRHPLGFISGPL